MLTAKLSMLEFWRSCSKRAPGGRDFLWMTLLMLLLQLQALIILSAREGVLERSVDAFLGNRPGYGIPVWTVPNFFGANQPVMITSDLVQETRDSGFFGAPFRRLENGEMVRMPGRDVWRNQAGLSFLSFSGMVVDFDGPLYPPERVLSPPAQVPELLANAWDIVLDENLFRDAFDLAAYRAALEGQLPETELAAIPTSSDQITDMQVIWLFTKTYRRDVLTPFKVRWSRHFGVGASDTAFMVPMEMYNAFRMARSAPGLCVFLENGPGLGLRAQTLRSDRVFRMTAEQRAATAAGLDQLQAALGGDRLQASRLQLQFPGTNGRDDCDAGVSMTRVNLFANPLGLDFSGDKTLAIEPTQPFVVSAREVGLPCALARESGQSVLREATENGQCIAFVSVADERTGYTDMLLYARDRLDISSLVDYLNCRSDAGSPAQSALCVGVDEGAQGVESRIAINHIYEDALTRFGFLTELLRAVSGPVGVAMLLMLIAILWVQLGTVLGHRRLRYAMLLSNGLSWGQVRWMVILQVGVSIVLSLFAALAIMMGTQAIVLNGMVDISASYEMITQGNPINVLPVNPLVVLWVLFSTLVMAVILALVQLRLAGITPRTSLDRLLQ